jgi:hypothetical protein
MGNTVLKSVSKQKAALLQQCGFFYILYVAHSWRRAFFQQLSSF